MNTSGGFASGDLYQQRGKCGAVCHLCGKWKQWKRPYPYRGKTAAGAERDRGDEHRSL